MDSATGTDQLSYQPQSSTATWTLGGTSYSFGATAFTAPVINVGTIHATSIVASNLTASLSAAAITSGTIAAARLPIFGPSGTTHAPGAVPDPGPVAGNTHFLREDGTWAVPSGAGGGGGASGTASITGGTIDNTTIGATTESTGAFTHLGIGCGASGAYPLYICGTGNQGNLVSIGGSGEIEQWSDATPDFAVSNGLAVPTRAIDGNYHISTYTPATGWQGRVLVESSTGFLNITQATPASSSAACTQGDFTDDANYHYVCVAANTWKRVALSSF
jgi:hypothetical protein